MTSDLAELETFFSGIVTLQRRDARQAWRNWTRAFCRGGPGGWDSVGGDQASWGTEAIRLYEQLSGAQLFFGDPAGLGIFSGPCENLPPYGAWLRLYQANFGDAFYVWEASFAWTLVLHHEQFGGLATGPILDFPRLD